MALINVAMAAGQISVVAAKSQAKGGCMCQTKWDKRLCGILTEESDGRDVSESEQWADDEHA